MIISLDSYLTPFLLYFLLYHQYESVTREFDDAKGYFFQSDQTSRPKKIAITTMQIVNLIILILSTLRFLFEVVSLVFA